MLATRFLRRCGGRGAIAIAASRHHHPARRIVLLQSKISHRSLATKVWTCVSLPSSVASASSCLHSIIGLLSNDSSYGCALTHHGMHTYAYTSQASSSYPPLALSTLLSTLPPPLTTSCLGEIKKRIGRKKLVVVDGESKEEPFYIA